MKPYTPHHTYHSLVPFFIYTFSLLIFFFLFGLVPSSKHIFLDCSSQPNIIHYIVLIICHEFDTFFGTWTLLDSHVQNQIKSFFFLKKYVDNFYKKEIISYKYFEGFVKCSYTFFIFYISIYQLLF